MNARGKTKGIGLAGLLAFAFLLAAIAAAPAAAAPTWLATTNLSAPGQDAIAPDVATDEDGDTTAVWERSDGSKEVIEASSHPAGGTWSAPAPISNATLSTSTPQVAIDNSGDAVAVWLSESGFGWVVESSSRPAGGAWTTPVVLSAPAPHNALIPRVAINAGYAVAIWKGYDGANWIVEASSRPAGGLWSAPVPLSAKGGDVDNPVLAMSNGVLGHAVAAWQHYNGTETFVESASLTVGGAWSAAVPISPPGQESEEPQVAIDSTGAPVAVWEKGEGITSTIEAAVGTIGGTWAAPARISNTGGIFQVPDVAVDATGNATVVWRSKFGAANWGIEASSRPGAGPWGAPVPLAAAGQDAKTPKVAMGAGAAVAVFDRFDGSKQIIEAARIPAGGTWGAAVPLSASGQKAEEPAVAMDGGGDAVTAWSRNDGSNTIIQSAVNDAAGPLLRNVVSPASGVTGQPLTFSVAPLDAFSALGPTTWSFGDGTTATGTTVTHAFAKQGTYLITLTGSDFLGNTTTVYKSVAITQSLASGSHNAKVKGKFVELKLSCLNAGTCAGTANLSAKIYPPPKKGKGKRATAGKPKTVVIGSAPFSLAGGKSATVRIKLSPLGLGLFAHANAVGVTLSGPGVATTTVRLKRVKPKKHHHSHRHGHRHAHH